MGTNYRETLKDLQNRLVSNETRSNTFYSTKTSSIDLVELFRYFLIEVPRSVENSFDFEKVARKCFELGKFNINLSKDLIPSKKVLPVWSDSENIKRNAIFKRFKNIVKESVNDFQQFSIESLRIGYPFVEGAINLSNPANNFKAPLFFFDLKVTKISFDRYQIEINKDFVINSSIISNAAVYNRVVDFKLDLDQMIVSDDEFQTVIDTFSFNEGLDENFIKNLIKTNKIYRNTGLSFFGKNSLYNFFSNDIPLEPLNLKTKTQYNQDNKESLNDLGECIARIMPCMSVGRYKLTSTGIFANYEEIKNLTDQELEDFFNIGNFGGLSSEEDEFKENEIKLISKLDYFQKLAIKKAQKGNLVIEGPPGTGKSQTISNIIANILFKRKTALFLTEKKVASEVVFERIDKLGNLALWIHNIDKDKESIYKQIRVICKDLDDLMNLNMDFHIKEYGEEMENTFEDISNFKKILNSEAGQEYLEIKKWIKKLLTPRNNSAIDYYENYKQLKNMCNQLESFSILRDKKTLDKKKEIEYLVEAFKEDEKFENICPKLFSSKNIKKIVFKYEDISKELFLSYLFNLIKKQRLKSKIGFFSKGNYKRFKASAQANLYLDDLNRFKNNLNYEKLRFLYLNEAKEMVIQLKELVRIGVEDFQTIEIATKFNLIQTFEEKYHDYFTFINKDWFETISNLNKMKIKSTGDKIYFGILAQLHEIISKDPQLNNLYGKLNSIISKDKGRPNIARLFKTYGPILNYLFPIKISSPNTSSNRLIFPWKEKSYDYIIFDEASQIFTENAIPSLFLAKKSIIAGDPKQLRPSNFFGTKRLGSDIDEEDFEELYENDDYDETEEKLSTLQDESLLDFALTRFPKTMLKFHYRSNHKELISFSSAAFYDNELYVSDKPIYTNLPLQEVKVNNGVLLRKEKINPREAEVVVGLVLKHVLGGDTSIGVITTNATQMAYIEDLLEEQAAKIPALSIALNDDSIFVKNIENVQGDERDIIIFSVNFAPDTTGKFINGFGPLSQQGGPNRLNVAITRSKTKMYVVKSINSSLISTKNPNSLVLKRYLEYVEKLQENEIESPLVRSILTSVNSSVIRSTQDEGWSDSEFELEVYEEICRKLNEYQDRIDVQRQIKQAGYRIDMTLYDKKEQKHILAIEADGAKFHTSTREQKMNDFYRQEYLESQGWKFKRILSTHWWDLDGIKKKEFLDSVLMFVQYYLRNPR